MSVALGLILARPFRKKGDYYFTRVKQTGIHINNYFEK